MKFIEAIILINESKQFELCDDDKELSGAYPSICVYKNQEFVGKLRWPNKNREASVDENVITELRKSGIWVSSIKKGKRNG